MTVHPFVVQGHLTFGGWIVFVLWLLDLVTSKDCNHRCSSTVDNSRREL